MLASGLLGRAETGGRVGGRPLQLGEAAVEIGQADGVAFHPVGQGGVLTSGLDTLVVKCLDLRFDAGTGVHQGLTVADGTVRLTSGGIGRGPGGVGVGPGGGK